MFQNTVALNERTERDNMTVLKEENIQRINGSIMCFASLTKPDILKLSGIIDKHEIKRLLKNQREKIGNSNKTVHPIASKYLTRNTQLGHSLILLIAIEALANDKLSAGWKN